MDTYLFVLVVLLVALTLFAARFAGFRPRFRRKKKNVGGIGRGSRRQDRAHVH